MHDAMFSIDTYLKQDKPNTRRKARWQQKSLVILCLHEARTPGKRYHAL